MVKTPLKTPAAHSRGCLKPQGHCGLSLVLMCVLQTAGTTQVGSYYLCDRHRVPGSQLWSGFVSAAVRTNN